MSIIGSVESGLAVITYVYQNESCTLLRIKSTAKLRTSCLVLRTGFGKVNKKGQFCFNGQLNVSTTFRACRYVHVLNISTARIRVFQLLLICSHPRQLLLQLRINSRH